MSNTLLLLVPQINGFRICRAVDRDRINIIGISDGK